MLTPVLQSMFYLIFVLKDRLWVGLVFRFWGNCILNFPSAYLYNTSHIWYPLEHLKELNWGEIDLDLQSWMLLVGVPYTICWAIRLQKCQKCLLDWRINLCRQFFLFSFPFLGPYLWHMEVPGLGVKSEL